jgi:hypothetical protein
MNTTSHLDNIKDGLFELGERIEQFDVEDTYLICKKPEGEEKVSRRVFSDLASFQIGPKRHLHVHVFNSVQRKQRASKEKAANYSKRIYEIAG